MIAGIGLVAFSISCVASSLFLLDSCPRIPLLSVWLLITGLVLCLLSLCLITMNICNIKTPTSTVNITKGTVVLMFLSTLMAICLVLTLISWLSVGTFWLAHDQPRLETEYDSECSLFLLIMCGVTLLLSLSLVLTGSWYGVWRGIQFCDCRRSSYYPVRKRQDGYIKIKQNSKPSTSV